MGFIEIVQLFNRKERMMLQQNAFGQEFNTLTTEFVKRVEEAIGHPLKGKQYASIDYHFDWLYFSLIRYAGLGLNGDKDIYKYDKSLLSANQQDVDLLIVCESDKKIDIVAIECKYDTGWKRDQFKSKIERLELVRDYVAKLKKNGKLIKEVSIDFVLISKSRPKNILNDHSQGVYEYFYIELVTDNRLRAVRCDVGGNQSAEGEFVKAFSIKKNTQRNEDDFN
jgi:hypothetical protein